MSSRMVEVTELKSELDPRAESLNEEARAAGVKGVPKASRILSAVVEYDGKQERWRLDEAGYERIAMTANERRKPWDGSVSIVLPEPVDKLRV